MFLNSIRWRLQLWHGLLLIIVLAGFGFTAWQLQRGNQLRRIDQELQRRVAVIGSALRRPVEPPGHPQPELFRAPAAAADDQFNRDPRDPPLVAPENRDGPRGPWRGPPPGRPPFPDRVENSIAARPATFHLSDRDLSLFSSAGSNSIYYLLWGRDGTALSRSEMGPTNIVRPSRSAEPNRIRLRGTIREVVHYTPPGECILVGKDISAELAEMRRFAGLLTGAGAAVLVLGLAGGWWLSTRAIAPIKDISATAAKISCGDLSRRVPVADTDNELGQLANVLNTTFTRLEAAFEQQARFTSDAAHELRTPVSIMLAQTQSALNRQRHGSEYRETVESCQRAAQRMRRLIESLLELARLDAGHQPMKRTRLDLAELVAACLEQVKPLAVERGITFRIALAPTEYSGDADRLALVVTNLLTNAIHYNQEHGSVHVRVERDDSASLLEVTDTGQGIHAEDLPHVFERFWRADKSRSQANGRCGLGLAIVKCIVDAHGGVIEVLSRPGKGSTFTVRLPEPHLES